MTSSVDWLEVELSAPAEQESTLALLLERRHLGGWVVEPETEGLRWVFYVPQEPGWKERLGALGLAAAEHDGVIKVRGQVRDEDWAENWKEFYHPRRLTRRLVLRPSWAAFQAEPGDLVIELDPGMAFGTGYHASTRLCLELLEEQPPAARVLDMGTGSGILSIAALLMGSGRVTAIDCDPVAVRVARENLRQNRLSKRARVLLGEKVPQVRYDLILANLIAQVLVEMAPELTRALAPGGRLVVGGIIDTRADEVLEAFSGLVPVGRGEEEGWVALAFQRPCG